MAALRALGQAYAIDKIATHQDDERRVGPLTWTDDLHGCIVAAKR